MTDELVTFGQVGPPFWNDRPVAIVGGGASLKAIDFKLFAACQAYVLGVNQAMFDLPACSAGITVDLDFVMNRRERLAQLPFELYVGLNTYDKPIPNAINLKRNWAGQLSDEPDCLISGGSSGYAALNLAYLKRATTIYLFGFDYGINGGPHYHREYTWFNPVNNLSWKHWAAAYHSMLPQLAQRQIKVFNASPESCITAFPKLAAELALAQLRAV